MMLRRTPHIYKVGILFLLLVFSAFPVFGQAGHDTVFVLKIGNSFSRNASQYLPQIAADAGKPLYLGVAEIGGCSLEKHWTLAQEHENDPDAKEGKPYAGGKSLKMLLNERDWDFVTIQQNSYNSTWPETYHPYAEQLIAYIRSFRPDAEVLIHQTWAYRSDAKSYGRVGVDGDGNDVKSLNDKEMWRASRAAYHALAAETGLRLLPVGDAMWIAANDRKFGYKPDPGFDFENALQPALPDQAYSMHKGYSWAKNGKLHLDANHASDAGCYLGGLVWYAMLFGESPRKLNYAPEGVAPDYAKFLQKIAYKVTKNKKSK